MKLSEYQELMSAVKDCSGLSVDCLSLLQSNFPKISYDTLYSIVCQEYQRRMKIFYGQNQQNQTFYWQSYKSSVENGDRPGILIRLSETNQITPCLLAKLILTKYFEENNQEEADKAQTNLNVYMKNTNLIPDMVLAYEVFLCTMYDNIYSPLSNTMRMSLGQQYEIKLHTEAVRLGIVFQDEEILRKNGYDKTPDCKLEIPVAVDGFIINWIESKALFGDSECHNEYKRNQYLSYWNRFGPGLVIYWFGFLDTIIDPSDKRFMVRDNLPTNIINLYENVKS